MRVTFWGCGNGVTRRVFWLGLVPLGVFLAAPVVLAAPVADGGVTARRIQQSVPFTVQAPTANWRDPLFQDACEEAVVLMAARWVRGKPAISVGEALAEIRALAAYSRRTFGTSVDQSAADTARLLRGYYGYAAVSFHENVTLGLLRQEVLRGNLVIVPMNGRKLGNPYYTRPGPLQHMLLLIGYDPATKEFITNDPGTRRGEGYRYREDVLFRAIRDYPTGNRLPIQGEPKTAIVIQSSSAPRGASVR